MDYKINMLQKTILDIYIEFNRICEKYQLTYYAIGGTCIGAIRHKGFIPWDDDLDVAMPIDDYLKFKEVAKKELKSEYKLIDYLDSKRFYRNNFFLKIENVNTTFVEKVESNDIRKYKGVFLDIMPICGCSKDDKKKHKLIRRFYKYRKLNQSKNLKFNEMKSLKGKILWIFLKPFVFFQNETYFLNKCEQLAKKNPINKNSNILFPWRIPVRASYKNNFPFEYFKGTVSMPFENTYIKCPIGYDSYLKDDFGDYMVLPPVEKRITHAPFLLDLNNSYIKYQEKDYKDND